jgi:hypothetical protein
VTAFGQLWFGRKKTGKMRTLVEPTAQLIVGSEKVDGSLRGGIVCGDGVDEGAQRQIDALELGLQNVVHGGVGVVAAIEYEYRKSIEQQLA